MSARDPHFEFAIDLRNHDYATPEQREWHERLIKLISEFPADESYEVISRSENPHLTPDMAKLEIDATAALREKGVK